MKLKLTTLVSVGLMSSGSVWSADKADILFLIDRSISMNAGLNWVQNDLLSSAPGGGNSVLGAALNNNGVTDYRFGLVSFTGFGSLPSTVTSDIQKVDVGTGDWGNAENVGNAAGNLKFEGDTEDGYGAIHFALKSYSFRNDAAVNLILITNEDRDVVDTQLTKSGILGELKAKNAKLNVVVNGRFTDKNGSPAIGLDSRGLNYRMDGESYISGNGGSSHPNLNPGDTTDVDYAQLAVDSGGAAWDLNRAADGPFTSAFINVKAAEIKGQPPSVPIPATLPLFSFGVAAVGLMRRKLNRQSRSA